MYVYDYIIIGSGIAGLYSAYKLKKKNPRVNLLVLEKDSVIGGRMFMEMFEGKLVETGAGIGRFYKDHVLKKLMVELGMKPPVNYPTKISYNFKTDMDILQYIAFLKQYNLKKLRYLYTFKQFFIKVFGKEKYEQFILTSGYTDFENADLYDTVYHYGFDDNTENLEIFFVDWNELAERLFDFIGFENFLLNYKITKVRKVNGIFKINDEFATKKIVFANNPENMKIYKNEKYHKILRGVKCQPFIRIYAKMSGTVKLDSVIHSNTHLQKIINMGDNILMIAYADNKCARKCNKLSMFGLEQLLQKNGIDNKIITFIKYYWKCGTHYYTPLSRRFKNRNEFIKFAQRPERNVYAVGEWISHNQGWVEGALESVENIF